MKILVQEYLLYIQRMRRFYTLWPVLALLFCGVPRPLAQLTKQATVLTGIDVLEKTHFAALRNLKGARGELRIGILTNDSGINRAGKRTIDILARDASRQVPGLRVVTLFSPEHGIGGNLDTAHANGGSNYNIGNTVDPSTGIPVISLFGNTDADRHPKQEQLRKLDLVVIDLQDAGVRFYTYETLTGYFIDVAEKTGTAIMVLDRPNPVRGDIVQGPTSALRSSYLNLMPIPLRHGLTLGEIARYYKLEKHLRTQLLIVPMEGWRRQLWFDETGLPWRNPSPNLRGMDALILYAGTGIVEATNISVGRGTDMPFTLFGAPWMTSNPVIEALKRRHLAGLELEAFDFTPQPPFKFAGVLCHGVRIRVTDRNIVNSPALGAAIASVLEERYRSVFRLQDIDPLKVDDTFNEAIEQKTRMDKMIAIWSSQNARFRQKRLPVLIY